MNGGYTLDPPSIPYFFCLPARSTFLISDDGTQIVGGPRYTPDAGSTITYEDGDVKVTNERTKAGGILIKVGMFAKTRLPVGEPKEALLVPLDALVLGGRTPMVYVIGEDSTVAPMPIELEAAIDGQAVVRGALQPGMQVVTEGNERLRPGQAVKILED